MTVLSEDPSSAWDWVAVSAIMMSRENEVKRGGDAGPRTMGRSYAGGGSGVECDFRAMAHPPPLVGVTRKGQPGGTARFAENFLRMRFDKKTTFADWFPCSFVTL